MNAAEKLLRRVADKARELRRVEGEWQSASQSRDGARLWDWVLGLRIELDEALDALRVHDEEET